MEKIKLQICINADDYRWIIEESVMRKHKNLSETFRELLRNYQIMIRSIQKAHDEKERLEKAKIDANKQIENFRAQILEAKPIKEG